MRHLCSRDPAPDDERHRALTGAGLGELLRLPGLMRELDFTVETLALVVPGIVEASDVGDLARIVAAADPEIPFTVLAYFPSHRMSRRAPTFAEMRAAREVAMKAGLRHVRLGNLGVFCESNRQLRRALALNADSA